MNQTRKGPYVPKQVLSEGNGFRLLLLLFLLSFSFLVCEQLLKDAVYPLAVKAYSVLDNYSIKKNTLLSDAARSSSSPFVGAFSLSILIYIYIHASSIFNKNKERKKNKKKSDKNAEKWNSCNNNKQAKTMMLMNALCANHQDQSRGPGS